MYLSREEERIYEGEKGWAYQVAMKILVKLGDLFNADRLIPIESAHISGVSYKTIGDASIDFIEALSRSEAKARVESTLNPAGIDYEHPEEMIGLLEIREKQDRIIRAYKSMGIKPILTCTPYYIKRPSEEAHLAWAESSTVMYANSVLHSWTNREGGPSALAAALIGKTPNYGVHRPENRRADVIVKVEAELKDEADYGALGIYVGRILRDEIPFLDGLQHPSESSLKHLGAAMASSGMASIFYYKTPYPKRSDKLEVIRVDADDMRRAYESLSTTSEKPDMVYIGCPHCSAEEIRNIAEKIKGRKVREDVKLWICTSRYVRERAAEHVRMIEAAGGKVLVDTCAVVT
ncbi:MAG TPA: DUF521 domain-containing protein, partial [Candidatus Bathyarchaeota archaeon]|nr:DUF521 domain-containing protein [Candidatus Bathyarchaeota archaeon]